MDDLISAEIPDIEEEPELHKIVIKHMIHNDCRKNENCSCIKRMLCSKRFPKDFQPETHSSKDGYPLYRRRS